MQLPKYLPLYIRVTKIRGLQRQLDVTLIINNCREHYVLEGFEKSRTMCTISLSSPQIRTRVFLKILYSKNGKVKIYLHSEPGHVQ